MEEIAVKIENVSKLYRLYAGHSDRVKEALHPLRRKYHQDFYALNNLTLDIRKGESIGIIGRNGSGKSTLLKMITGVITPTHGKITLNGRISALLELGAGFNPELTGRDNIFFNGAIMGYTPDEMKTRLKDILSFADIGVFIDQPVKMYSSGMFVRLAFAVAINVDPDILIIDEALAVGDFSFQAKCYNKFREFRKAGKTILFVTHSLDNVIRYCDRAIVLDAGRKISETTPKEAVDVYKKLVAECYTPKETTPDNSEKNPQEDNAKPRLGNNTAINGETLSYGKGGAEILEAAILDDRGVRADKLFNRRRFSVQMKVKFLQNLSDPIFAFTIKDLKGMEITGTNTWFHRINIGEKRKDEEIVVRFKQEVNLQSGGYALSLGCTGFEDGNFVVHHRLYDVILFEVISDTEHVGFYDPKSEIEIVESSKPGVTSGQIG